MRRLNRLNSVSTNLFIKRLVKELLIHLEIIVYTIKKKVENYKFSPGVQTSNIVSLLPQTTKTSKYSHVSILK